MGADRSEVQANGPPDSYGLFTDVRLHSILDAHRKHRPRYPRWRLGLPAFLDADELQTLTGYVRYSKQIEWLTRNHVPHYVNRFGRPVVQRDLKQQVSRPALGVVR